MKSRIPYTKPSITELEVAYATEAARYGWGERCYEYIARFEKSFKAHLGIGFALATSSCTGALHMGLSALGIGPGDEVIMADINWIATASPIVHLGAKPVFVDILPDSWCIDPELVEHAITPNTKAIIAVHLYGNLCEMDKLLAIGNKYNIPIIEDAAEAIGSIYHGKRAGTIDSKFGVFSFHGTKTLTTGEGGMFVTDDPELYERVLTLSNHGRSRSQARQFWPDMVGFKYKMSNIQAAIGLAQLERIQTLIDSKRRIFNAYKNNFAGLPVVLNPESENTINGYWMPTIVVNESVPFDRANLLECFNKENIDGRVFFWPLSDTGHFKECKPTPVAHRVYSRAVNLPSYHDLTNEEITRVCNIVRPFIEQSSNE